MAGRETPKQIEIAMVGEDGGKVRVYYALDTSGASGVPALGESTPLWTPKAVAAEVGVTVVRVWQLLAEGRFPLARKVGGRWYIPEADVRAYLAHPDRRRKDVPRQGELPGVE